MRSQDFTSLGQLTLKWLNEGKSRLLDALLRFLSERGLPDPLVFDHLLQLVLGSIGSSYATGSLSIGDEHYMAHAIRDSLIRYCPASANCTPSLQSPIALVGCARGVSHELGAIMVRHLLTVSGWRVVYLGPDVPTEEYSLQQLKHGASLVCISLVQPISLSEVKAIKMLLDQMYNPSCPYALAFGGSSINNEDVLEHIRQTPSRIENMRCFSSLEPFDAWSRSILAS